VKSVTGIIPEELHDPTKMGAVVDYLKAAPLNANDKVKLLMTWARQVGVKVSSSQRAAVAASGLDER
jgi:hypothetical protein